MSKDYQARAEVGTAAADAAERRVDPRVGRDEVLFVQAAVPGTGSGERRTIRCRSADLSSGGLRVRIEDGLPVGTSVELWIKLPERERSCYLLGTVCWCAPVQTGAEIGVEVQAGPGTDFEYWRAMTFTG